jgi:hypothetical protein
VMQSALVVLILQHHCVCMTLVLHLVLDSFQHHSLVRGARQVLISREITLRHKELKIARLTLVCNHGKSLILHLSNCQNCNWTYRHFTPICFIDVETLCRDYVEFLHTAALGRH